VLATAIAANYSSNASIQLPTESAAVFAVSVIPYLAASALLSRHKNWSCKLKNVKFGFT
jgi:hypothetical protein